MDIMSFILLNENGKGSRLEIRIDCSPKVLLALRWMKSDSRIK